MTRPRSQFNPDYAQAPGAYLGEVLGDRGIRKTDFATRCGRPTKTISEIIGGKTAILPDTALQFERVLGDIKAAVWLRLEADYQLFQAREREREGLARGRDWANKFPISDMRRRGYIGDARDTSELVLALLNFFGVSSVDAWEDYWHSRVTAARFKNAGRAAYDPFAVAAWLQRGDTEAAELDCAVFSELKLKANLEKIRALTLRRWPSYREELVGLLSQAGVAIAFVPDLHKLNLRGAAYWAAKDRAVILLSDRLKREHKFWFALVHEIMHILLHSKKALFIDFGGNSDHNSQSDEEREADEAAANFLIPASAIREFVRRYGNVFNSYSETAIRSSAKEIGVSPALLLARLQKDGLVPWRTRLNTRFEDKFTF